MVLVFTAAAGALERGFGSLGPFEVLAPGRTLGLVGFVLDSGACSGTASPLLRLFSGGFNPELEPESVFGVLSCSPKS